MVYSTKPVAPKAHEPRYCIHCRRPLQAVGHARKNGKRTHGDWKGRQYHKRCLKLLRRAGGKKSERRGAVLDNASARGVWEG